MRDQLRVMSGQLKEMQEEGRAWVGPTSVALAPVALNEPLALVLSVRNFGKKPATFVRHNTAASYFPTSAAVEITALPQWRDPRIFYPRALCSTESLFS